MAGKAQEDRDDDQREETDKHPASRGYHHGNLRQALVDAAVAIIGEEGAAGFQLRAVARRAGVSPAAPYRHFRDKADLLAEVGAEGARRLRVLNLPEVASRFDDDLRQLMGDRDLLAEAIRESDEAGQLAAQSRATVALAARSITYGLARLMVDGHLGPKLPTVEEAERAAYAVTELLGVGLLRRD